MAGRRVRRKKRLGGGTVILGLLLTLLCSAAVVGGVYLWASRQGGPSALIGGSDPGAVTLRLFTPQTAESVAPPESAPAPPLSPQGEELPFDMVEIVGQEEGLLVGRVMGKRFKGFLAVVDDPLRLYVATCPVFAAEAQGLTVKQMADNTGAVLAVNGGGFADPGGEGAGGAPQGNVFVDGRCLWAGGGSTVGMDASGQMHVGELTPERCLELGLQWALSYGPVLIEDGQIRPNLDTYGREPRTAVGQLADGRVLILNIQGRQASAIGVTCQELAEILYNWGCVNAGNLDGGASSDMYYGGDYINICNGVGGPRPIPTSLQVGPVRKEG